SRLTTPRSTKIRYFGSFPSLLLLEFYRPEYPFDRVADRVPTVEVPNADLPSLRAASDKDDIRTVVSLRSGDLDRLAGIYRILLVLELFPARIVGHYLLHLSQKIGRVFLHVGCGENPVVSVANVDSDIVLAFLSPSATRSLPRRRDLL